MAVGRIDLEELLRDDRSPKSVDRKLARSVLVPDFRFALRSERFPLILHESNHSAQGTIEPKDHWVHRFALPFQTTDRAYGGN